MREATPVAADASTYVRTFASGASEPPALGSASSELNDRNGGAKQTLTNQMNECQLSGGPFADRNVGIVSGNSQVF